MSPLFTDTTCTPDVGSSSREEIYKLFEDEDLRIILKQAATTDDSLPCNIDIHNDVANSFLHRIAAHTKILPYTDMVRLVVDHLDIMDKKFITLKKKIIGSFKVDDLRKWNHLPQPQNKNDTQFV